MRDVGPGPTGVNRGAIGADGNPSWVGTTGCPHQRQRKRDTDTSLVSRRETRARRVGNHDTESGGGGDGRCFGESSWQRRD